MRNERFIRPFLCRYGTTWYDIDAKMTQQLLVPRQAQNALCDHFLLVSLESIIFCGK
jgi:hypothetical protein